MLKMGFIVVAHLIKFFENKNLIKENQLEGADALPYLEEGVQHLEKACERASKITSKDISFKQIEEAKSFFT